MIRFYLEDKSPDEEVLYSIDWTKHLGNDTLDTTAVPTAETLEGTAVVDTLSNVSTTTTNFFARGGALGDCVRALIHVKSVGNQTLDAEIYFGVR